MHKVQVIEKETFIRTYYTIIDTYIFLPSSLIQCYNYSMLWMTSKLIEFSQLSQLSQPVKFFSYRDPNTVQSWNHDPPSATSSLSPNNTSRIIRSWTRLNNRNFLIDRSFPPPFTPTESGRRSGCTWIGSSERDTR